MKATGIIRRIDDLGRIVIPKEIRKTMHIRDYFITTYTKPSMFDTISTYVVNATKGAQTDVKTALWALSTIIFLVVIFIVIGMNHTGRKEHDHEI